MISSGRVPYFWIEYLISRFIIVPCNCYEVKDIVFNTLSPIAVQTLHISSRVANSGFPFAFLVVFLQHISSASSGHALTLPLCGNPTTSKAAALSKSHAIEVFSFPELQQPTTQQTPTTQLLCSNLTPSKVLSKVSLILLLWPTLLEPS